MHQTLVQKIAEEGWGGQGKKRKKGCANKKRFVLFISASTCGACPMFACYKLSGPMRDTPHIAQYPFSSGRGCLGEGRLGLPGPVWELRFLPSFPSFPMINRSSKNVWETSRSPRHPSPRHPRPTDFRDSIAEGGIARVCLVFIGYRVSIAEIPLTPKLNLGAPFSCLNILKATS